MIKFCNHTSATICQDCELQNAQTLANRAKGVCDGVVPVFDDEVYIEELKIDKNGLNARMTGTPLHLFAEAIVENFKESGATNFVEMQFTHEELGHFVLTMQKSDGLTPAAKLNTAEGLVREAVERLQMPPKDIRGNGFRELMTKLREI